MIPEVPEVPGVQFYLKYRTHLHSNEQALVYEHGMGSARSRRSEGLSTTNFRSAVGYSSQPDSTDAAAEAFRQLRTKLTNHNPGTRCG